MSREYFNKMAPEWDEFTDHNEDIIREVVAGWPDFPQLKVLDVGAGTGVMVPFLQEKYDKKAQITEIDFAQNMIKEAERKFGSHKNIKFIHGDIFEYSFPCNYFDLVICYSVFPHFEDKVSILDRLYNLLNEGGLLVIFHSDSREEINSIHSQADQEVKSDRLPPVNEVVRMAQKIGFKVDKKVDNDRMYLLQLIKEEKYDS